VLKKCTALPRSPLIIQEYSIPLCLHSSLIHHFTFTENYDSTVSGNHLKQILWVRLYDETKDTSMLVRKASSSSLMYSLFIFSTSPSRTCQKKNSSKNMLCMRVNESTLNTLVTYRLKFFSPRSLPLVLLSLCPATWVELKQRNKKSQTIGSWNTPSQTSKTKQSKQAN